jgi:hypothetical protein
MQEKNNFFFTGKVTLSAVNLSVDGIPINMVSHGHGQFYNTDGPVQSPQDFRRLNLFGKFHTHLTENSKLSFDVASFTAAWNASGQIPERAVGAEVGFRSRFADRFHFGAALRGLDLESEFVYVGDAGTTAPSGRTRRYGVDLEARLGLLDWLWADVDANISNGKLRDEPEPVSELHFTPGNPRNVRVGLSYLF